MVALGIDYGRKHIGVALSRGDLADPLTTVKSLDELLGVIRHHGPDIIVLGLPDGETATEIREIAKDIEKKSGIKVEFADEYLTSKSAVRALLHKKRTRRRDMEHQAAAAIILQNWMDMLKSNHV